MATEKQDSRVGAGARTKMPLHLQLRVFQTTKQVRGYQSHLPQKLRMLLVTANRGEGSPSASTLYLLERSPSMEAIIAWAAVAEYMRRQNHTVKL